MNSVKKKWEYNNNKYNFLKFDKICDQFNTVKKTLYIIHCFHLQCIEVNKLKQFSDSEDTELMNILIKNKFNIFFKNVAALLTILCFIIKYVKNEKSTLKDLVINKLSDDNIIDVSDYNCVKNHFNNKNIFKNDLQFLEIESVDHEIKKSAEKDDNVFTKVHSIIFTTVTD